MSTDSPRQSRDPRQAELLREEALRPQPFNRTIHTGEWIDPGPPIANSLFIATDPPYLGDALVEVASGIFGLIRRDDVPAEIAALIDDWRMDYALKYIPARLAADRQPVMPPGTTRPLLARPAPKLYPPIGPATTYQADRLVGDPAPKTKWQKIPDWVIAVSFGVVVVAALIITCGFAA